MKKDEYMELFAGVFRLINISVNKKTIE